MAQQSSDYISIATVNRRYSHANKEEEDTGAGSAGTVGHKGYRYNTHELSHMIQSSLQSLRLVAQLSAMY